MVRPFPVVPEEMPEKLPVELSDIEKLSGMEVHELFLDGPVEPFIVGIHLRALRIRLPVGEVLPLDRRREVLLEFTPVVREDIGERHRKQLTNEVQEAVNIIMSELG